MSTNFPQAEAMGPRNKSGGDGRRRLGALLLSLLLAACATTPEVGWQARHAAAEALREAVRFAEEPLPDAWSDVSVTTAQVPINDADLEAGTGRLIYAGGVQITSDFNRLHGLSDIKFDSAESFYSISDEGLLVRGRVQLDAGGRLIGVQGVQVRPLTDPDGRPLIPKYLADAEGLALLPDGELLVSFERLHRVWRYDHDGRWRGERAIPDFAFTENEGMEGISPSTHADRFWASGENGGVWSCLIRQCVVLVPPPAAAPSDDDLRMTSLATLGDGIYGLRRAYHADRNTNTIEITELALIDGEAGPDLSWRPLARFTAPATVDNFEGLAAVRRPDGGVRLYILSDDNFNPGQRTLLLAFDVR
ncbi:MAG: esterase-like activity of phytase family protein [Caulobacterales bacterium]|nr:esterase-like activity of phytase family protein [Caulobacterales bacterium]